MRITISPAPIKFSCAHRLTCVPEGHKCRREHGHTYRLILRVSCDARCLDPDECSREGLSEPLDMVMDYGDLIAIAKIEVYDVLDHRHLNEFLTEPTTENLAGWIWPRIARELPKHTRLDAVEVHEGDHVCILSRF